MAYNLIITVAWASICIFLAILIFPLWLKEQSRGFLLIWTLALTLKGAALAGIAWLIQLTPASGTVTAATMIAMAFLAASEALIAAALVSLYGANRPFRFTVTCLAIWACSLGAFTIAGFGLAAMVASQSFIIIVIAAYTITVLSPSRDERGLSLRHVISSVYAVQAIMAFTTIAIYLGSAHGTGLNSPSARVLIGLTAAVFAAKVLLGVWISIEKFESDLRRLAYNDPLTGILNRRGTLMEIESKLHQNRVCTFAYLTIDIDHFKAINDRLGHSCGDHALNHFTRTVGAILRRDDVFGRMGGEEFAVFANVSDTAAAVELAERIRTQVQYSSFVESNHTITLTVSIGVAVSFEEDTNLQTMLNHSDHALYQAKEAGRNRSVLYRPSPSPVRPSRPAASA